MGVKGFPTLKIVRPGKTPGRTIVEDYQGQRNAKAIVEIVKEKIKNNVKKVTDDNLEEWLQEGPSAKAMLFSDKGTTSALIKALAIDYLGSISVAQIRDKEKTAAAKFGVTSYPTFVLLPGGDKQPITYDGEMTKEGMTKFLSQAATPNPDPAPKKPKASKSASKDSKKASKDSSSFAKASASHAKAESSESKATQTMETMEEEATESPNPNVVTDDTQTPIKVPKVAPMIPSLETSETLQQACLTSKSGTCVLALPPADELTNPVATSNSKTATALKSLSEIYQKHTSRGGKLFPFYIVPGHNTEASNLRSSLSLGADTELAIVAVNGKRSWLKRYSDEDYSRDAVETWIDAIRMGEGKKDKLPEALIVEPVAKAEETKSAEPKIEVLVDDLPLDFSMEELSDEDVEMLLNQAGQGKKEKASGHEEL